MPGENPPSFVHDGKSAKCNCDLCWGLFQARLKAQAKLNQVSKEKNQ